MAKLARVSISVELWQQWMTQGFKVGGLECTEGLPEGAAFVRFAEGQSKYGDVSLVFWHDSFEDVELGSEIPKTSVMFTTFTCPERTVE